MSYIHNVLLFIFLSPELKVFLRGSTSQVELFIQPCGDDCLVSIQESGSESIFVREAIRSHFGGLCVPYKQFLDFLSEDARLKTLFDVVEQHRPDSPKSSVSEDFSDLPLGQKLVACDLFDSDSLSLLLDEYSRLNLFDRFGDFLTIRSFCPSIVIDFLVDPSFVNDSDFNSMLIEDRLFFLQLIDINILSSVQAMRSALGETFSAFEFLHDSTELSLKSIHFFASVRLRDGRCVPG